MISAYLEAYRVLGDESAREFALKTLDFLTGRVYRPDAGLYHLCHEGKAEVPGYLEDHVQLSSALLDAFEISGEPRYLATAIDLMDYALHHFWDGKAGGFFETEPCHEAVEILESREKRFEDAPVPGGNAVAAMVLDRLFSLTHDGKYRERAEATLRAFAGAAPSFGATSAGYALAVERHLNPPPATVIIGRKGDLRTEMLRRAANSIYRPGKDVAVFDPEAKGLPYPPAPVDDPIAYICAGTKCGPPTNEPEELADLVGSIGK